MIFILFLNKVMLRMHTSIKKKKFAVVQIKLLKKPIMTWPLMTSSLG